MRTDRSALEIFFGLGIFCAVYPGSIEGDVYTGRDEGNDTVRIMRRATTLSK